MPELAQERMAKMPFKERAILRGRRDSHRDHRGRAGLLQYSWSNQVSEATSLRLADSLQMSMINWHLDLFRDFSQICLALGVDPDGEAPADLQQFARSFADWKAGAPYPELVSGLYILRPDTDSAVPVSLRFDPVSGRFEPSELAGESGRICAKRLQAVRVKSKRAAPGTPAAAERQVLLRRRPSNSSKVFIPAECWPAGDSIPNSRSGASHCSHAGSDLRPRAIRAARMDRAAIEQ